MNSVRERLIGRVFAEVVKKQHGDRFVARD
jgi:hypothetical protein